MNPGLQYIQIQRNKSTATSSVKDVVAVEAPLEIQIQHANENRAKSISVTMRTPGNDVDLALGFLFTEGLIKNYNQVKNAFSFVENTVVVQLNEGETITLENSERNFYTTSSCGVCGKSSIEAIQTISQFKILNSTIPAKQVLFGLKKTLEKQQSLFSLTGGIHAAALFNFKGEIEIVQEDVGRHNALDKLIGEAFQKQHLPLENRILLLSGRASFELVQKAIMSGISTIVAVGAPSSLAVELAREHGQTLIGFLKQDSFNIYSGSVD
jgi:FdhD protein